MHGDEGNSMKILSATKCMTLAAALLLGSVWSQPTHMAPQKTGFNGCQHDCSASWRTRPAL